jgi:hypothetical protein
LKAVVQYKGKLSQTYENVYDVRYTFKETNSAWILLIFTVGAVFGAW